MRGIVVDLIGVHRADDAEVVGHPAEMREETAHFLAGLAELLEVVLRAETFEFLALQLRDLLAFSEGAGHGLAVHFLELGLEVPGLEMRRPAGHVEMDDALRLRWPVQRPDDAGPFFFGRQGRTEQPWIEQRAERERADAGGGAAEEGTAVEENSFVRFISSS